MFRNVAECSMFQVLSTPLIMRLRQLRIKLISRVVKGSSDSLFPGERRLISPQYSGMLSISLRFHCLSPDMFCTAFIHAKPPRNLHAAREENNWRRITYGLGCVWGNPSLSSLSSLGFTNDFGAKQVAFEIKTHPMNGCKTQSVRVGTSRHDG